jgi:hypothetical protein
MRTDTLPFGLSWNSGSFVEARGLVLFCHGENVGRSRSLMEEFSPCSPGRSEPMSEYQYYEFQAVDRPLTDGEMDELRQLSTRADITRTSFTNTYQWGNFRGDPRKMMEKYFDSFVYAANWGTHRFILRLPRALADAEELSAYEAENVLDVWTTGQHVLLEFHSDLEGGDDEEESGEEWMPSLLPVRDSLLAGDLRAAYLGWLSAIEDDSHDLEDDAAEPPVPPGLNELTGGLERLAQFMRISPDLLQAAAAASPPLQTAGFAREDVARWIGQLPLAEKDALLLRVLDEDARILKAELVRRYRESLPEPVRQTMAKRRTAGELREAAEALAQGRQQEEARRRAEKEAKRKQEEAAEFARRLDALEALGEKAWAAVERLAETKRPNDYGRAVGLLKDLKALADRQGQQSLFTTKVESLRQRHSRKPSFLQRLNRAGL